MAINFLNLRASLEEKKLTPAELKKREEVAKAIERENPNMPMGMKMAIATKTAKRVAEEEQIDELRTSTLLRYSTKANKALIGGDRSKEEKRIKGIQKAVYKIKSRSSSVKEESELDELNQMTLQRYASKAYRVGMQGGPKSAKHLAGAQRAKEKLKYGDYSEEIEQVDEVVKQAHKVVVTVSEPDHPMVSKRKETVMKRVVVHATDKGDAKAKAESFYKKKGYKVHGSEYHSVQPASTLKTEETLDEVSKKTAVSYIQKKVSQIAKRPGESMLYTTKMTDKDYSNLKKAYKRAGVKEEVKDEYARKVSKYLKKKYNKEEYDLDEASQFPSKEHAIKYAKEKVKTHKDSDDGIEVYSMPGGGARVVHTMNDQGRQQVLKGGGKKVTTVTREQVDKEEVEQLEEYYTIHPHKDGKPEIIGSPTKWHGSAISKTLEHTKAGRTVTVNYKDHKGVVDSVTIKPGQHVKKALDGLKTERTEEAVHYCAKHVYSELFGEGQVVEGDHAEPNEAGHVEWYNVQFEHGIEKVFTEDIEIMMAEYHANHKRKKRMTNGR